MADCGVRAFFVTHFHDLASGFYAAGGFVDIAVVPVASCRLGTCSPTCPKRAVADGSLLADPPREL